MIISDCRVSSFLKTLPGWRVSRHNVLGSRERSSNREMRKKSSLCIYGHKFGPPKYSSGANDVISMFVHLLSFECCGIMLSFEC